MTIARSVRQRVVGREWYHQRFDGSPLYLFDIGEAEIRREPRKPNGTEADVRVCFFKDGKADWYLDMKDVRRGSEVMIRLARKDTAISTKLLKAWENDEQRFQKLFDDFANVRLRQLSDQELLAYYERYRRAAVSRFTSSAIIDHFALGTDEHIAKMLRQEVGSTGKESDFTEVFSIATAPVHQSFINQAEMELLKIAIEAPTDRQRITAHQQKYFWIKNNYYSSHVLTVVHFQREIKTWRTSGGNLTAKYHQLRDAPKVNRQRKAALFRQHEFSRLLRTLLRISEDFTWWQDERKKATYLNIHLGTRILGEMARRRKYLAEATKFMVAPEVKTMFVQGQPTKAELRERMRNCAVVMWRNGVAVYVGKDAEALRRMMFPKKGNDQVRDIRGLSASVGRAVGPVKIVGSVRELDKVHAGDILVAVMTRPDYITGIKKAAAIVTNEGGITCHAAIVSRELGIPCVIGTKIATEVLKDGDIVEVNANHGVVTVLKH